MSELGSLPKKKTALCDKAPIAQSLMDKSILAKNQLDEYQQNVHHDQRHCTHSTRLLGSAVTECVHAHIAEGKAKGVRCI